MKLQRLLRISVFTALGLFPAGGWAMLIDNFDNGAQDLTANAANPVVHGVVSAAGILGGERDLTAIYSASGSTALGNMETRVDFLNQDNFSHNQDAGVSGMSQIVYDGADGDASTIDFNGLGGIDLTSGNANGFALNVLFADQSVSNVLNIRVYSSATDYSDIAYSFGAPINSATLVTLLYSSFALGNGAVGIADFTNVNAILLSIDGSFDQALDVRIDSLSTNEQPVVPEPATLSLLGLGLAGIGFVRRRAGIRRAA